MDVLLEVIRLSDISTPVLDPPRTVKFVGWPNNVSEIDEGKSGEGQHETIEDTTVGDTISADPTVEDEIVEEITVQETVIVEPTDEDQIEKFTDIASKDRRTSFTLKFINAIEAKSFYDYFKPEDKKQYCF